ncbi:MAG TPA: Ig-like domain-containing protein, partial [Pelobium sp.]|nr:Ig-like domain-containing protein [Pelobium sp.]
LWDNGAVTENLNALTAGSYNVTITDANGCSVIKSITISQPLEALTITETHTDASCFGTASGSIDISVSGGKAPYTYSWSNGATTKDLSALFAGDYVLTVKDANNCLSSLTITLNQPSEALELTESHQDILCYGDATGSIDLIINGGTAPYTYLWSNNSTSSFLSEIKAGIYTVVVTDAKGCTIGKQIKINQPAAPLNIAETHQNVDCFGSKTGSISIRVLGGTAPYSYEWSNGIENQNLTNLAAGSYEIKVTDKNGCTVIKEIQITQPVAPISIAETHQNNACYSESKGKIELRVIGGTPPYQYKWSNGATTQNIANLPAGLYSVVVTDKNGCSKSLSAEITPLTPFVITEQTDQIKCFGENSGEIALQLSGGGEPYQVKWSNGATGSNIQNLTTGSYTYVAKDAYGCILTKTITINEPEPLVAQAEVKNTTCKYSPDGAIKINVSGGTKPYRFIWNSTDRGQKSTLVNINAGLYNITVIDANNCTVQLSAEVFPGNCAPSADNDRYQTEEDKPIIIQTPGVIVNDYDPDDDDLRITLSTAKDPQGETGNVSKNKSVFKTKNGEVSLNADGSFTYTPNKNFYGIEYFVYEVNDGDLKSDFAQVTIMVTQVNDPPSATTDGFETQEDVPVNGFVGINDSDPESEPLRYVVTNQPSSGTLIFNPDGTFIYTPEENYKGTVTFDYQVCDSEGLCDQATVTIVVIPVNDAPIAGDDKFSLQRNGQVSETVTANDSDADGESLQFTKLTDPSNGTVTFNANGTFTYQPQADFKGIDQFTYTACDPSGLCDDATVTLIVQPVVTVNLVPREAIINEGDSIKITAVLTESLVEDVTIYLSCTGTATLNNDYVLTDNYLSFLIPANQTETSHYFSINTILDDIKDDNENVISNITSTSKPAFVNIGNNSTVLIKDVYPESVTNTPSENPDINPDPLVSPNGDGLGNETFVIYNISKYPNNEVVIFNRWGNKVYETRGYDNKGNSFKGIANVGILTNSNKELVDGVYYYLIYTDEDNKRKLNKGYLILKR